MEEEEFYSRLKNEMSEWQKDGIIESTQAEAIMKRYGVEKKTYKPGNMISAISTIAVILIGVGIILFFASNWVYIPDIIKIVLLIVATFSTYYAGYVMKYEKKKLSPGRTCTYFPGVDTGRRKHIPYRNYIQY